MGSAVSSLFVLGGRCILVGEGGHKCINYHERWHFWQNHRPLWGLVPTSFVGSHQCIGAEKSLFPAKCFVITIALYFHPFHLCSFILRNNFILLVNFFCQRIFHFIHTYKLCQLVMVEKFIEVPESRFRVPEVLGHVPIFILCCFFFPLILSFKKIQKTNTGNSLNEFR